MKARLPAGYGGGGPQNMNSMIKQAQKMQEGIQNVQEEIAASEFKSSVGGGAVEAVMMGNKELKSLTIKPEVVDPEDIEMLEDLVISAVNEVLSQIDKTTEEKMNAVTGGASIPGLF